MRGRASPVMVIKGCYDIISFFPEHNTECVRHFLALMRSPTLILCTVSITIVVALFLREFHFCKYTVI